MSVEKLFADADVSELEEIVQLHSDWRSLAKTNPESALDARQRLDDALWDILRNILVSLARRTLALAKLKRQYP